MSLAQVSEGDVIQFNEKHKWCGALAIVTEVKPSGDDVRIMAGVPILKNDGVDGTAYIFTMQNAGEFDPVGRAALAPKDTKEDEDASATV